MTRSAAASVESCSAPRDPVDASGAHCTKDAPRILESRRFGRLEVWPDKIISFPTGVIGFEDYHEYVLVQPAGLEPLSFLVAYENPEVAFPVLPAELCQAGYAPEIPPAVLEGLGLGPTGPFELLAICTTAPDTGTLHANLRGPVIVNPAARIAGQVVLHDNAYSLRHLLGAG
jgi:flagellar assembly factor FliW